jgi:hypothetical protein
MCGKDAIPLIGRHSTIVETLWCFRKVREGIDGLARRTDPVPNVGIECHQVTVDLVGQLHHRGFDDAICEFVDVQGEFSARESKVDTLLLVDHDGRLDLVHVLDGRGATVADGEVGGTTDLDRVTGSISRHPLVVIIFVTAIDLSRHHEFVVEDFDRSLSNNAGSQLPISH